MTQIHQEVRSSDHGFGLAEVLLASGILILVVASIVSLSRFVVRGYAVTASRIQANYLAQEGIEIVRAVRDSYWIDDCTATNFANLAVDTYTTSWGTPNVSGCSLSARWNLVPVAPGVGQPNPLGFVTFTREISIADAAVGDPLLDPHMKQVTVTVRWNEGGRPWDVRMVTYLTNWRIDT